MHEKRKLFVLVVEKDRVVAAMLATVLHSAGYMVGTAESDVAALRIGSRMVVDAVVTDVGGDLPTKIETAAALQEQYPACRILALCARSQADETRMLMEENGVDGELLQRPLSRAELVAKLAAAPGASGEGTSIFAVEPRAA